MKWKKLLTFRWILLGLGLVALLGLTGLNVYSLYALHENTLKSSMEKPRNQLLEVSNETRNIIMNSLRDRFRQNIPLIEKAIQENGDMPESFYNLVKAAYEEPVFIDIYFSDSECEACDGNGSLQKFNPETSRMEWTNQIPDEVKDGIGMSRTRMRVLVQDYQYSTRVFFDTHRSLTIAFVNTETKQVVGYLLMTLNREYIIQEILEPMLLTTFGEEANNSVVVWLHDWTRNQVLASSHPEISYQRRAEDFIQSFPEMLNNWNMKAAFMESPLVAAANASLIRNLTALGVAVFLLIGALVFMFITAQKERELALRQAGFLANVTHELKTPLAVMQAAGENLADGRVKNEERLRAYGKHIFDESMRLRRMIEKLLDVAKSDAGQLTLKPIMCDLAELTRKYLDDQRDYIEEKGFTIDFTSADDLSPVMIDPESYETMLSNLVENAIKYSFDEKYLGIRVFKQGKKVIVDVEDRGIGIPQSDQKNIFEKFYRVEDPNTATTKGHGLGLSIVKDLANHNGGDIRMKSSYRKGSTFSLHFPIFFEAHKTRNGETKPIENRVEHVV